MKNLKNLNNYVFFFCLFVFATGFALCNAEIKKDRKNLNATYSFQTIPIPAKAIPFLAGEFKGIVADNLLLQMNSFIGSGHSITKKQWKDICQGFEQVMELDPYFEQTYLQAQAFLSWEARMPKAAIAILEKASVKRPWDWRPGYYIGFDHYYFLDDYDKASEIFLKTSQIKDAPVLIALLGSRFAVKGKRIEASLEVLEQMKQNPGLTKNAQKEIENRIIALTGIRIIEKALDRYKAVYHYYPLSLDMLVTKGILQTLPVNPYSVSYGYSPGTGKIVFDHHSKEVVKP